MLLIKTQTPVTLFWLLRMSNLNCEYILNTTKNSIRLQIDILNKRFSLFILSKIVPLTILYTSLTRIYILYYIIIISILHLRHSYIISLFGIYLYYALIGACSVKTP